MNKIKKLFNFDNIGDKIKGLTKWACWISIILVWVAAAILIIAFAAGGYPANFFIMPILGAVILPFIIWVSSWTIYAFGELVSKTCDIEHNTCGGEKKSETQSKIDSERISKLERLRSQGLITEEEYRQALSKEQ